MKRVELLSAVDRVSSALGVSSFNPILSCLCFDSGRITAYDGTICLRAACEFELDGCANGRSLSALLNSSKAEEVDCSFDETEAKIKLGRTKASLALMPTSDFPFIAPKKKGLRFGVEKNLIEAFQIADRSAGRDAAFPTRLGVTCVFGAKKLTLYATDNLTVVRVVTNHKFPDLEGTSFILLPRFYNLMSNMVGAEVIVGKNGDIQCRSDDLELFGKTLDKADGNQFEKSFTAADLYSIQKDDVPKSFARSIDRALIANKELTEFRYSGGKLSLNTKGQGIEINDKVAIDLGEDDITVCSSADLVSKYLPITSRIGFSTRCIVMEGEGFQAMIGVRKPE